MPCWGLFSILHFLDVFKVEKGLKAQLVELKEQNSKTQGALQEKEMVLQKFQVQQQKGLASQEQEKKKLHNQLSELQESLTKKVCKAHSSCTTHGHMLVYIVHGSCMIASIMFGTSISLLHSPFSLISDIVIALCYGDMGHLISQSLYIYHNFASFLAIQRININLIITHMVKPIVYIVLCEYLSIFSLYLYI